MSADTNTQDGDCSSFEDLGIRAEVVSGLHALNITRPHPIQARFLEHLLNKPSEDLMGVSFPGTGKTTACCIGVLESLDLCTTEAQHTIQAVILLPTSGIACLVYDRICAIGRFMPGLAVLRTTPTLCARLRSAGEQIACSVVVGTPGTVGDMLVRHPKFRNQVRMLILDEGDDMSQGWWNSCWRVKGVLPKTVRIGVFSATCTGDRWSRYLAPGHGIIIMDREDRSREWPKHFCIDVSADDDRKLAKLLSLVSTLTIGSAIIFVKDRACKVEILNRLLEKGFAAAAWMSALHEDDLTLKEFVSGRLKIILASPYQARDLRIFPVLSVFIYDVPPQDSGRRNGNVEDFLDYLHCLGRAGYYPQWTRTFSFIGGLAERKMLGRVKEYFGTEFPRLEWDDDDQLEDLERRLIRPRRKKIPGPVESVDKTRIKEQGTMVPQPPGRPSTGPAAGELAGFTFGTHIVEEPRPGTEVSTATFGYLNDTIDKRLEYMEGDERIRIAVLDTGIDLKHADFKNPRTKMFTREFQSQPAKEKLAQIDRIKAYRNFHIARNDEVDDLDGHGTQVAGIILRLAPNADLYIARVCAGKNRAEPFEGDEGSFRGPHPSDVADAVNWAIEQKVHIINMSLGFRNKKHESMKSLKEALASARAHKILVFAAASNEGLHEPTAWPATEREYAIGIHSSTDAGKESNTTATPVEGSLNFMVVGEQILSHWPTDNGGGFRLCTGSSFAAPVATAIGALILAFTRQYRCKPERREVSREIDLDELHTNLGMAKVLKRISERRNDYHWIASKLFWREYHDLSDPGASRKYAWGIIERALKYG
ncbi:peptidase S8/S53 domain-containing protein [Aspergillus pseudoustus]|uniref:ATP-dependent RNA helicase n=1 Tax=Aspergillus pseudoustus TaxID=1810923 RepID=A0ABR4J7I6_9EURO